MSNIIESKIKLEFFKYIILIFLMIPYGVVSSESYGKRIYSNNDVLLELSNNKPSTYKETYPVVSSILEEAYSIKGFSELFSTSVYYKLSENIYISLSVVKRRAKNKQDGKDAMDIVGSCKYISGDLSVNKNRCVSNKLWSVIDIANKNVIRIPDVIVGQSLDKPTNKARKFAELPIGISIGDNLYYGCYSSYRFGRTDLNGDGEYELVALSGTGGDERFAGWASPPNDAEADLFVSFYSIGNTSEPLFDTQLVYNKVEGKAGKGKRVYSKLFFGDYNDNGKLDILVWKRIFDLYTEGESDPFKERLSKEELQWFEQPTSTKLQKYNNLNIDQSSIQKFIGKLDLKWIDGFPSKDVCAKPRRLDGKMTHGLIGSEK